jgi:hypothetical protein
MMLCIKFASAGASAVIPGACTPTGATERNAAYGAAAGAAAGAVIGNNTGAGDAGQGAAIAAVVGGLGGATKGWIGSEDAMPRASRTRHTSATATATAMSTPIIAIPTIVTAGSCLPA